MPSKTPPSDDVHTAKVAVHEITAALPDMLCVELRDPPLRFGKLYHKADGPILEGAYAVVNCVASPRGAIRIICRGGPFAPWFFDEGNSAPLLFWGIGGVPGANGLFEGHKIDSNTMDLIDTTFSGSYTSGGHFRKFFEWIQYPPAGNAWGWVCGRNGDYFRAADTRSEIYLNRALIDNPANWPPIGGRTVTAVYRKSTNYRQGFNHDITMGQYGNCASLKHFVYLKLDGPIPGGAILVNFPSATKIDQAWFTGYSRAIGFHVSGIGHRPGDASKYGYFSLHIPKGPKEGAVNLADYGITTFDVIDGTGERVLGPLPLTQRIAATESEDHMGVGVDNILGGYPDVQNAIRYSTRR